MSNEKQRATTQIPGCDAYKAPPYITHPPLRSSNKYSTQWLIPRQHRAEPRYATPRHATATRPIVAIDTPRFSKFVTNRGHAGTASLKSIETRAPNTPRYCVAIDDDVDVDIDIDDGSGPPGGAKAVNGIDVCTVSILGSSEIAENCLGVMFTRKTKETERIRNRPQIFP